MKRRTFITGLASILVAGYAPAIVSREIIMPVRKLWTPRMWWEPREGPEGDYVLRQFDKAEYIDLAPMFADEWNCVTVDCPALLVAGASYSISLHRDGNLVRGTARRIL